MHISECHVSYHMCMYMYVLTYLHIQTWPSIEVSMYVLTNLHKYEFTISTWQQKKPPNESSENKHKILVEFNHSTVKLYTA